MAKNELFLPTSRSDIYTCAMVKLADRGEKRIAQIKSILMEGNKRHVNSAWEFPNLDHSVQDDQSMFMWPKAAVMCGSDCRIVPNFIFDQGFGFLHVVQIGGPIASTSTLAAVDYAVIEKEVSVVIVLCSEDDPVMRAAMDYGEHGENIATQSRKFRNTYSWAASEGPLDIATMNAQYVAYKCTHHSVAIGNRVKMGVLEVVPALYDVLTGEVTFLPFWTPDEPTPFDISSARFFQKFKDNPNLSTELQGEHS